MNTAPHPSGFHDHIFAWTLTLSLALHIFAVIWLPSFKFDSFKAPEILDVKLAPPKAPEPPPAPLPEPPKAKVEPEVLPKSIPKIEPKPIVQPPPKNNEPEPVAHSTPPAVMTAEPKADTPPTFTAPPPEPPKPNNEDLNAARNFYGGQITREIAKHKEYPKIAERQGWQGEVKIDLYLDSSGNVLPSSKIHTSSGHEVLDKEALEMIRKASPFPAPPDALRESSSFYILQSVPFRLE